MSRSRIILPFDRKLTLRMSCSERKSPDTCNDSFSLLVWTEPAGTTLFCAWTAAIRAARSMPSPASCWVENSMKICSSWAPMISIFDTSGTFSNRERTAST